MSISPEHAEGANPESDHAPLPYYRAARFRGESVAGHAYDRAQALIYRNDEADLSVFRFHIERDWYVALVGEKPVAALHEHITQILHTGVAVELPPPMVQVLAERRRAALKQGNWVERHYLE